MKGQIYEQEKNEEEARETYKQGVRSWTSNKPVRAVIINVPDVIARDLALAMLICVFRDTTSFLVESMYLLLFQVKKCPTSFPLWILRSRVEEKAGKMPIIFNFFFSPQKHIVELSFTLALNRSSRFLNEGKIRTGTSKTTEPEMSRIMAGSCPYWNTWREKGVCQIIDGQRSVVCF